jgi:hypothetical protein
LGRNGAWNFGFGWASEVLFWKALLLGEEGLMPSSVFLFSHLTTARLCMSPANRVTPATQLHTPQRPSLCRRSRAVGQLAGLLAGDKFLTSVFARLFSVMMMMMRPAIQPPSLFVMAELELSKFLM